MLRDEVEPVINPASSSVKVAVASFRVPRCARACAPFRLLGWADPGREGEPRRRVEEDGEGASVVEARPRPSWVPNTDMRDMARPVGPESSDWVGARTAPASESESAAAARPPRAGAYVRRSPGLPGPSQCDGPREVREE